MDFWILICGVGDPARSCQVLPGRARSCQVFSPRVVQTVANKGEPKLSGLDPDPAVMCGYLGQYGWDVLALPTSQVCEHERALLSVSVCVGVGVGGWV